MSGGLTERFDYLGTKQWIRCDVQRASTGPKHES